jgi:hypothetical protein
MKREVIRYVNALRKKEGLSIEDRVAVYWQSDSEEVKKTMEEYRGDILKSVLADNIYNDDPEKGGINKEVSLGEEVIKLGIKKE